MTHPSCRCTQCLSCSVWWEQWGSECCQWSPNNIWMEGLCRNWFFSRLQFADPLTTQNHPEFGKFVFELDWYSRCWSSLSLHFWPIILYARILSFRAFYKTSSLRSLIHFSSYSSYRESVSITIFSSKYSSWFATQQRRSRNNKKKK